MEKVIKFSGWTPSPNTVTIGMERDNKVFSLKFEGMPDYPNGTAYLHIDCGENGADSIEVLDGTAEIKRNVTQYEGEKEAYVEILADGDVVWHSDVIMVTVKRLPILGKKIEQAYPTAFEQALAQTAADKAAAAKSAADAAATAAGIVTEEKARQDAERKRVDAETARENAEGTRAEKERLRANAESERVKTESARKTAEGNREKAEAAREQETAAAVKRADDLVKSVEDKLENGDFVGAQGPQGPQGPIGETGPRGEQGVPGAQGEKGEKGDTGATGPQGVPGTNGADGAPGKDGRDGLDAPQIDDTTVSDATPWSSQHIVDMLCPSLEERGNPVVCYPVAGSKLGVKVNWEPTQEGEGTPYPAGGGKNLFRLYDKDTTVSANGLTAKFDLKAETLTVTGTSTKTDDAWIIINQKTGLQIPDFAIGETYTLSWTNIAGMYAQIVYTNTSGKLKALCYLDSKAVSFTVPTDYESFFAFQIGINQTAGTVGGVAKIQLEKGSTATAYAPYANIRPIHGRDSVQVERCGKNLLNIAPFTKLTKQGITYEYVANGGVRISGTATATVDSPTFAIGHLPPGKYYGLDMGTGIAASIVVQRNGANLWLNAKGVFEILAGDIIRYWYMITNNGMTLDTTVYPYIVPGTTAPATYTPYTGSTTTLTLPSTIYGGEVDAQTGEGLWAWRLITLDGTENWKRDSSGGTAFICNVDGIENRAENSKMVCSHAAWGTTSPTANYRVNTIAYTLYLVWPNADGDAVKLRELLAAQYAAGTPVQIAYKVATPVPFTATGGGTIKALSGTNTILTDADALTVTGRADPIHIIQQLQAASAASAQALADVERAVTDI